MMGWAKVELSAVRDIHHSCIVVVNGQLKALIHPVVHAVAVTIETRGHGVGGWDKGLHVGLPYRPVIGRRRVRRAVV